MRRRDLRTDPTAGGAGDGDVSTAVGTPDGDAAGDRKPPEGTDDAGSPPPNRSRRRLLILIGAVVGLLVIALVALLLTQNAGRRDPMNVVTITHQAEPPTPEVEPIEREKGTPLLEALPDVVLGYAVTEQTESATMLEAFALEGWTLTYTGAEAAVVLQIGQWPTDDEAQRVFADIVGEEAATAEGEVLVGGEAVGTFVVQQVDGGERTVWRNGTAVLVAEGPSGATQEFYEAFPF